MSKYEVCYSCNFTHDGLLLGVFLFMSLYLMEPNILGSLGLKLGVLSFMQHLKLHLPGQYALVLLKESILLATLLSKVGSKV